MLRITTDKEVAKFEGRLKAALDEATIWEQIANEKNNTLRAIYRMLSNYQMSMMYGGASYRQLIRQIKEKVEESVEKKLSDEMFPNYTSNNSKQ